MIKKLLFVEDEDITLQWSSSLQCGYRRGITAAEFYYFLEYHIENMMPEFVSRCWMNQL